jgi:hypothetical protein
MTGFKSPASPSREPSPELRALCVRSLLRSDPAFEGVPGPTRLYVSNKEFLDAPAQIVILAARLEEISFPRFGGSQRQNLFEKFILTFHSNCSRPSLGLH